MLLTILSKLLMFVGATVTSSWTFSVSNAEVEAVSSNLFNLWWSFFGVFMKFLPMVVFFGVVLLVINKLTGLFHKG